MRAILLYAFRDSGRPRKCVRRLPRAGLFLSLRRAAPPSRRGGARGAKATSLDWWRDQFDARYLLEYEPIFAPERDRSEVARLLEVLQLPTGARILDVPCGQGRHSHLLAEAGFDVTGLDYSRHLLGIARARGTSRRLRYQRGDMRALPARWRSRFDAVVNLFTSFGFFAHPRDDVAVMCAFARTLRPGGVLVWHGGSRDGICARFVSRDWWTSADGTMVGHERSLDPLSGVLTVRSTLRGTTGPPLEREHRIRLYTATRLAELCTDAGLVVEQAWDGWSARPLTRVSTEMLLVARKTAGCRLLRTPLNSTP